MLTLAINNEDFTLGSTIDVTVKQFHIVNNREVLFLPKAIGQKLPKLVEFFVRKTGLKIVRNFYFNDMQKLERLHLVDNAISTIEMGSFKDLISVEAISLANNVIETLYEKLFILMIKLEEINLKDNNIKSLEPTIFNIPNGKLTKINLLNNACLSRKFIGDYLNNISRLIDDLETKCRRQTNWENN